MVMLIAGGSLFTGSHDPYCGTLMPLGPSTPSVGVDLTVIIVGVLHLRAPRRRLSRLTSRGLFRRAVCRAQTRLNGSRMARCGSVRPRQGEHPLHVPRHGHEAPLAAYFVQATQHELAEPDHRFDDPEYRLGRLLAQGVALLALFGLEPMAHRFNRRWIFRCGRVLCETFSQRGIMRLPS